jgi:protein-disulfide isomerase
MARENAELFVRGHSRVIGPAEAKVHLIEFTDPACETCAAFHPFTRRLMQAHPGKIKVVVRYAPFHAGADQIVRVIEAAARQADYERVLDLVLRTQETWAINHQARPELLIPILGQAGLDVERLRTDMNDPAITRIIQPDLADAQALGVQKTPGFFANGKPLVNFGYQQLQALVETEVRAAYPNGRADPSL